MPIFSRNFPIFPVPILDPSINFPIIKCAKTSLVKDLMTKDMYTIKMDTSVEQCMALMDEHHFRHLPVVEDGQMLGILSIRDVLTAVLQNKVREIMGLENYMTASNFLG